MFSWRAQRLGESYGLVRSHVDMFSGILGPVPAARSRRAPAVNVSRCGNSHQARGNAPEHLLDALHERALPPLR